MSLSQDLQNEIRQACESQNLDPENAVNAIEHLVGEDAVLEWTVWGGPGWSQENLLLDVYLLSSVAIYNHSVFKDQPVTSATSATFLNSVHTVALITVSDARTPHMLIFRTEEDEFARVFGDETYLPKLKSFLSACLAAMINARGK